MDTFLWSIYQEDDDDNNNDHIFIMMTTSFNKWVFRVSAFIKNYHHDWESQLSTLIPSFFCFAPTLHSTFNSYILFSNRYRFFKTQVINNNLQIYIYIYIDTYIYIYIYRDVYVWNDFLIIINSVCVWIIFFCIYIYYVVPTNNDPTIYIYISHLPTYLTKPNLLVTHV